MDERNTSIRAISPGVLCCFISLLVLYSINFFQRTAVPGGIFSYLQNEMALNATQIAMLGACFTYVYAFLQIFVGIFVDRFGGIKVNLVGSFLFVVGCVCFPLATNVKWMYFARLCTGIGASTTFLCIVHEANAVFGRKNYAIAIGVAYFCAYFGGVMATLPLAYVFSRYSWRAVLLGVGLCALASYLCMLVSSRYRLASGENAVPRISRTVVMQAFRGIVCNKYAMCLVGMNSMVYSIYFVILTILGKKFLEDIPGLSPVSAANVLFYMSLSIMVLSIGSNTASRLLGNRRKLFSVWICILNITCSCGMVLAILLHLKGWIYGVFFCGFAAATGFLPVNVMHFQEINDKSCTTLATGFLNMSCYLSVAIFSMFSGIILDLVGCNAAGVYPRSAYLGLFIIFIVLGCMSFAIIRNVPETSGKYLEAGR